MPIRRRSSVAAAAGGGAQEEVGETPPLPPLPQKQPANKARPKVVTHWGKTPGEEDKTGEQKADNDEKDEEGKKEKRKGTARRVSTGKGKKEDLVKKEKYDAGEKQKKKKTKKKVRMSDDAPEVVEAKKSPPQSTSKWAGIHAALRLWR